jgi:hypothetical protein
MYFHISSFQLLCLLMPSPPVSRSLLLLLGFPAKLLQQTALALDAWAHLPSATVKKLLQGLKINHLTHAVSRRGNPGEATTAVRTDSAMVVDVDGQKKKSSRLQQKHALEHLLDICQVCWNEWQHRPVPI